MSSDNNASPDHAVSDPLADTQEAVRRAELERDRSEVVLRQLQFSAPTHPQASPSSATTWQYRACQRRASLDHHAARDDLRYLASWYARAAEEILEAAIAGHPLPTAEKLTGLGSRLEASTESAEPDPPPPHLPPELSELVTGHETLDRDLRAAHNQLLDASSNARLDVLRALLDWARQVHTTTLKLRELRHGEGQAMTWSTL